MLNEKTDEIDPNDAKDGGYHVGDDVGKGRDVVIACVNPRNWVAGEGRQFSRCGV